MVSQTEVGVGYWFNQPKLTAVRAPPGAGTPRGYWSKLGLNTYKNKNKNGSG